ncbi:hypothetical protein [Clostridium sp.]|uniref:hypothetical protein n=1 Tax=Clostridium sp. TaxID=1506 RepID=UPI003217A8F9
MNHIEQLKSEIDLIPNGVIEIYANLETMTILTNKDEPYQFKNDILTIREIKIKCDEKLQDNEVKFLLEENIKKWVDGVIEENKKYKIINLGR